MTGLLACLPMTEHLAGARESAQRTYDRRRARTAADTLATIPPNRWDDETRRIIATLATISSPSRIDDALEAFDGQPADNLIEIHDEYDPGPVPAEYDMPSPYESLPPKWSDLYCGQCPGGHNSSYAAAICRQAHRVHDNGDYRA